MRLQRITLWLVFLIAAGYLLRLGGEILAPLAFSFLLSLLLVPLCRRLERRLSRGFAILVCLSLLVVVLTGMVWFFSYQIIGFQEQLPLIETRGTELLAELGHWIERRFHIDSDRQIEYLRRSGDALLGEGGAILGGLTGFTGDLFTVLGLMPIYIFFILYYRNFFMDFLDRFTQRREHHHIRQVAYQIEKVSQSYLLGLLTVIVVVAVLNTTGLLLLGIENAVFFGTLASVLAVIPYIGIAIGSILPMLMALVTKDSAWYAFGVLALMGFVQFLEGNFITPNIVGSRVAVNPLVAVLALLVAAGLWGPAGMILAIPATAVLKVIFDNVESLKPFGFIIGEPPKATSLGRRSAITRQTERMAEHLGLADKANERPERDNEFEV